MRENIHPAYPTSKVHCACGATWGGRKKKNPGPPGGSAIPFGGGGGGGGPSPPPASERPQAAKERQRGTVRVGGLASCRHAAAGKASGAVLSCALLLPGSDLV